MDIFSPCALGAIVNPNSIKTLKCSIIAGAANNQLEKESRDSKLLLKKGAPSWSLANLSPMKGIGWLSMLPFITQGRGEDEPSWAGDYGEGLDLEAIRKEVLARNVQRSKYPFLQSDYYAAQGGRIGYQDGLMANFDLKEWIWESNRQSFSNSMFGKDYEDLTPDQQETIDIQLEMELGKKEMPQPDRAMAQEGGLMDLGGMEKDYREEGGFVPIGGQERADDVPARLSKNEFVFTADAVRAAGGGDIDKGAEVMENVMNNLEQGGQVSEESQGLEGARNMFATAQRLEGVL